MRERQRDIVEAFEQALLLMRLDLEMRGPSEIVGHRLLFEIDREPVTPRSRRPREKCASTSSAFSVTGRKPFFRQLLWKISANSGAITARKPASSSAHTACSRELPHPKLLRATKIDAPWYRGLFSTKSLFSLPSRITPPIDKQPAPQPGAHDRLEELLRDDLIGIDIGAIERRYHPGKIFELLHLSP